MNTTLTTFDGFPRSDIDVAQSMSFFHGSEHLLTLGQSGRHERA